MEPLGKRLASLNFSLSGAQTIIGLTAGILSILGALLAAPGHFKPAPGKGRVVTVIQEAKTDKSITDATVEIMTAQNALITTLSPNFFGKAKHSLEEGQYRVRVSHPKFAAELRQIQVIRGETTEIKVRLRSGASAPLREAERLIDEGVGAIRRMFGQ
jgi:PEGA domain